MDNPWYSFYVGDYQRKTAHLSLLEHGAYRLLIDHYMATKSPLPSDPAKLFRICRATNQHERHAVLFVTSEFFDISDDGLHHRKCDEELSKLLKYKNRQSNAAKLRHSQALATVKPRARVPQPQPDREGKPSLPPTPIPEWVDPTVWEGFKEMRKGIKSPMTGKAEQLIFAKLNKLRAQGHDPTAVLEQSIRSNWKDVYKLKEEHHANARFGNQNNRQPTKDERARAAVYAALSEFDHSPG